MAKKRPNKKMNAKFAVMVGLEHGWPRNTLIVPAPDFNNNLRASEIVGCAYGLDFADECQRQIPILSLMVKKPEIAARAFDQFKSWITATGPDALRVEILYVGAGYELAIGPDATHMLWRTSGLRADIDQNIVGITYIKPIDTRNSFLDDLADYGTLPISPVYFSAVHYVGPDEPSNFGDRRWLKEIPDFPRLLLLNFPVYKTTDDIPITSGFVGRRELDRDKLKAEHEEREASRIAPEALTRERERRLRSLMPMSMHRLRTDTALQKKVLDLQKKGFAIWQVEQAIMNQLIWASATKAGQYKLKKSSKIGDYLESYLELGQINLAAIVENSDAVIDQIRRDATSLLESKGEIDLPTTISAIQELLVKFGYVRLGAEE